MSSKSFEVIINNTETHPFTVRVENFSHESFLRLLRVSNVANEISDECFVDGVFYDNFRAVNFNDFKVIKVYVPSIHSQNNNVIINTPLCDSDVENPIYRTPRCVVNRKKTPEAPRKRKRYDEEYSDDDDSSDESDDQSSDESDDESEDEAVEDGSDDSHVEALYCIRCFGFNVTTENPIIMCKNRKCSICCHKNCSKGLATFTCDLHNKKKKLCRKLF